MKLMNYMEKVILQLDVMNFIFFIELNSINDDEMEIEL